ncbi:hypothetical protein AAG570_008572 [Ranatra chinensis]|uniref:Uncharacterized protein n=1 Tax=Ranatra chinensis TaxID=642074 RepID=A0ABD0ZEL4_9HEMI
MPPIVVNGTINDVKSFLASCQRVTKTRVTIKNTGRTTQVFAGSKEDHTALRELFVKNNLLYHTYAFKGERRKKWVIHGLTASAPVGEILEDVRQTIPGAVQVIQMTKTDGDGRKRVLPTFILITNAGVTQKEFKNLVIYSHYVQVQKYTTEEAVTQCYRCQLFGHSSRYCNLQQKCVRCAGNHRASECDREKIKPKCANCKEAHVASYKTCQARTRYVESRESKRKKETYHIPPIYHAPPDLGPRNPGAWRRTTDRTYAQVTAPPPPPSQEDTFGIMGELQKLGKEDMCRIINPEYKQRVQTALATCNNEAKLEKEVILKILTEEELPANQNEKCFIACVMKDMGMIVDGQFDAEETKRQNREKYTGDDLIKADNTVQKCADSSKSIILSLVTSNNIFDIASYVVLLALRAPKDLEDECELAFQLMKCRQDEKRALAFRHSRIFILSSLSRALTNASFRYLYFCYNQRAHVLDYVPPIIPRGPDGVDSSLLNGTGRTYTPLYLQKFTLVSHNGEEEGCSLGGNQPCHTLVPLSNSFELQANAPEIVLEVPKKEFVPPIVLNGKPANITQLITDTGKVVLEIAEYNKCFLLRGMNGYVIDEYLNLSHELRRPLLLVLVKHVSALRRHLHPRVLTKLCGNYPQSIKAEDGVHAPKQVLPLHDEGDEIGVLYGPYNTNAWRDQTWLETSAIKSNMKYCLVVLLALCAISSAEINPEYKQRVQTALATCNNEAKLEKEVILKILTEEELPANQNEKCFIACVMKDLGMIVDGQFDAEETKRQNREKYTGDDLIKADNTVQKCTDSIPKDLEDECELAFQLMKCKRDEKRAVNLQPVQYD